jgi:hypothetical protein
MKKVLIVTYSFPPAEDACAARADSFVRQLSKYGWEPLILAGNMKARSAPGTAGSSGLKTPEDIDIIRTAPWQPENLPALLRPVAGFFSSLLVPDKERLWEMFCVRKAMRAAKSAGIDLIYTLSPPSSSHIIGMRLKAKNPGIPWVADFCSEADTEGRGMKKFREQYLSRLINSVLDGADCIITGDGALGEMFAKVRGDAGQHTDICHVPDGNAQALTEQFEKTCRTIAARKLNKGNNE